MGESGSIHMPGGKQLEMSFGDGKFHHFEGCKYCFFGFHCGPVAQVFGKESQA